MRTAPFGFWKARNLGQVVAEGGPEHVVDSLCLDATYAGPAESLSVAVLDALAETAVFTAVDVIPVANGTLLHISRLVSAGAAGIVARRAAVEAGVRVGKATGVACQPRTVADR